MKKTAAVAIALLLTGNALLFYAFSDAIFLLVMLSFAALFLYVKWQNAIAISASLAFTTLLLVLALGLVIASDTIYYRPHEMFSGPDGRYRKNVHFEMKMPHGDLKAMALHTEVTPEPRTVLFQTDSLGYRNTEDYRDQKYLLVGDSFIVGNGSTQKEILTEQLLARYGVDTYNLAFPGGVKEYAKSVEFFRAHAGSDAKIILFLFEGNDFPLNQDGDKTASEEAQQASYFVEAFKNYRELISSTDMYRFIFSSTRRIYAVHIKKKDDPVKVWDVVGRPVAFYQAYISDTERDVFPVNTETERLLESLKDDIAHIFLIPAKYRVYYKHLKDQQQPNQRILPDRQWQYVQQLGKKLGIPTTNLTPALTEGSDRLLEQGILTYWSDDTHWNRYGIAIAADAVREAISERNRN